MNVQFQLLYTEGKHARPSGCLPDFKFILDNKEEKISQELCHCRISWFLMVANLNNCCVVAEELNSFSRPRGTPQPDRDDQYPELFLVDRRASSASTPGHGILLHVPDAPQELFRHLEA